LVTSPLPNSTWADWVSRGAPPVSWQRWQRRLNAPARGRWQASQRVSYTAWALVTSPGESGARTPTAWNVPSMTKTTTATKSAGTNKSQIERSFGKCPLRPGVPQVGLRGISVPEPGEDVDRQQAHQQSCKGHVQQEPAAQDALQAVLGIELHLLRVDRGEIVDA